MRIMEFCFEWNTCIIANYLQTWSAISNCKDGVVLNQHITSNIVSISNITKIPQTSNHYSDVIMGGMASQITGVSSVWTNVCSGADQRKHQSSAPLAFVRGIHRWPVNSPHKGLVMRKMFPFDDVIMSTTILSHSRDPLYQHFSGIWPWISNCIHCLMCDMLLIHVLNSTAV